jgi:hypothetical protein
LLQELLRLFGWSRGSKRRQGRDTFREPHGSTYYYRAGCNLCTVR